MNQILLTVMLVSLPFAAMARTMTPETLGPEDLITTDPLGYECISAQFFEEANAETAAVAFQVGGKLRLARTCLPNPCEGAITQAELASLTGTDRALPRFNQEWNDYYARYADFCRRETTPVPDDFVASGQDNEDEFWAPLLAPPAEGIVETAQLSGLLPSTSVVSRGTDLAPTTFGSVLPQTETRVVETVMTVTDEGGSSTSGSSDDGTSEGGGTLGDGSTVPITVVPLPATGSLLLLSLALFALFAPHRKMLNH